MLLKTHFGDARDTRPRRGRDANWHPDADVTLFKAGLKASVPSITWFPRVWKVYVHDSQRLFFTNHRNTTTKCEVDIYESQAQGTCYYKHAIDEALRRRHALEDALLEMDKFKFKLDDIEPGELFPACWLERVARPETHVGSSYLVGKYAYDLQRLCIIGHSKIFTKCKVC